MNEAGRSIQNQFFAWLNSKIPLSQLSQLYLYYTEIDSFCLKTQILKKPLLQTTDLSTIALVKKTVETNKIFRFKQGKHHLTKLITAIHYYYIFIKEASSALCDEKCIEHNRTALQPPPAFATDGADTLQRRVSGNLRSTTFFTWLTESQNMAVTTCRSYVSAIGSAERFAEEHQLTSTKLYSTNDYAEAESTVNALLNDKHFIEYNAQQHNRFRAAMNKYLQYLQKRKSSHCRA